MYYGGAFFCFPVTGPYESNHQNPAKNPAKTSNFLMSFGVR